MKNKIIISLLCVFLCLVLFAASFDIRDNSDLGLEGTLDTLSAMFSPVTGAFDLVVGVVNGLMPKYMVVDPDAVYSDDVVFLIDYFLSNEELIDNKLSQNCNVSVEIINDKSWIDNFFNFNVFSSNFHSHKVFSVVVYPDYSYVPGEGYECFYCSYCDEICGVRTNPYGTLFNSGYEWRYPKGDVEPSVGLVMKSTQIFVSFP